MVVDGGPETTVVTVHDNTTAADPADPIVTWTADLTTSKDWLVGVVTEATYEGFGFENGVCAVARWGSSWGPNASPIPYDVGDLAYATADSALYLGPCGSPMTLVTRELWLTGFSEGYGSANVRKTDFPMFSTEHGIKTIEGYDDPLRGWLGYDVRYDGWGVSASGEVVPVFEDVDNWFARRRGTTLWTLRDRTIYRVDAARALR